MSKLERLNARVARLLTEAVQEVLEVVKETVSEYQEKTARTQRENESLKRRLQELQDKIPKESTHENTYNFCKEFIITDNVTFLSCLRSLIHDCKFHSCPDYKWAVSRGERHNSEAGSEYHSEA